MADLDCRQGDHNSSSHRLRQLRRRFMPLISPSLIKEAAKLYDNTLIMEKMEGDLHIIRLDDGDSILCAMDLNRKLISIRFLLGHVYEEEC